jgi:hypothetical protein
MADSIPKKKLKKKTTGPTYIFNNGLDEVTIPFPAKKIGGYYTSMRDIYEDGMKAAQEKAKSKVNKNIIPVETEYERILNDVIKSEGGTPEKYKKHLDHVAYHESAGTMKPDMKQSKGGPARGIYQYEPPSARTAVNRAKLYYQKNKRPMPEFITELDKQDNIDFGTLSREQQDAMYLIDKYMGEADFSELMSGKTPEAEWWGKYHQTTSDPIKNKKFADDAIRYDKISELNKKNKEKPAPLVLFKRGGILYKK